MGFIIDTYSLSAFNKQHGSSLFLHPLYLFSLNWLIFFKDRIYPDLQLLLGQDRKVVGRDAQWEQTLARAVCIRDICRERSEKMGKGLDLCRRGKQFGFQLHYLYYWCHVVNLYKPGRAWHNDGWRVNADFIFLDDFNTLWWERILPRSELFVLNGVSFHVILLRRVGPPRHVCLCVSPVLPDPSLARSCPPVSDCHPTPHPPCS